MADNTLNQVSVVFTGNINDLEAKIRQAGNLFSYFEREARSSFEGVSQVSGVLGGVGLALTMGLTRPIMDFAEQTINAGMEFDSTMAQVQAVTAATSEEFQKLRDQAIELGKETVFTANDSARAQAELAKAGMDIDEVYKAMPAVLDLASAGMLDIDLAASIVARSMNTFGEDASKVSRYADILAKAANSSATDVRGLGEALSYGGPSASAMNYSIEQTIGIMSMFSNQGIDSTRAGTAFEAMMRDLNKTALKFGGELPYMIDGQRQWGIAWYDSSGNVRDFADILADMEKQMAGMTYQEQKSIVNQWTRTQAQRGLNALLQTGSEKLRNFTQELYDSDGVGKQTAETMRNTLAGSVEQLSSSVEAMQISFSDMFTPIIRAVVIELKKFVDVLTELPAPAKAMLAVVAGLLAALGPLIGLLALFGPMAKIMITAAKTVMVMRGAFTALSAAMKAGTYTTIAFETAAATATAGTLTLSGAMGVLFGTILPIIAVVAALVAVVYLVYTAWDNAIGKQKRIREEVEKTYKPMADTSDVMKQMADAAEEAFQRTSDSYFALSGDIKTAMALIRAGLADESVVSGFYANIEKMGADTVKLLTDQAESMAKALAQGFAALGNQDQALQEKVIKGLNESYSEKVTAAQENQNKMTEIARRSMEETGRITDEAQTQINDIMVSQANLGLREMSNVSNELLALSALSGDKRVDQEGKIAERIAQGKAEAAKKDLDKVTTDVGNFMAALDTAYSNNKINYDEYVALKNDAADLLIKKQQEVMLAELAAINLKAENTEKAKKKTEKELQELTNKETAARNYAGEPLTEKEKERKKQLEGELDVLKKQTWELGAQQSIYAEWASGAGTVEAFSGWMQSMASTSEEAGKEIGNNIAKGMTSANVEQSTKVKLAEITAALGDGKIDMATEGAGLMSAMDAEIQKYGIKESASVKALELAMGLEEGSIDTPEKAKNAMQAFIDEANKADASGTGRTIGEAMIDGIAGGIRDFAPRVKNLLDQVVSGEALENLKKRLGINSPSKVMRDVIGKRIMEGIAVGILDGRKYTKAAASTAINGLMSAMEIPKRMLSGLQNDIPVGVRAIGYTETAASLMDLQKQLGVVMKPADVSTLTTVKQDVVYKHEGKITVEGTSDEGQFKDVVEIIVDQLRKEVRVV